MQKIRLTLTLCQTPYWSYRSIKTMKIGEISIQTGVSQRMIRHFESLNLLKPDRLGSYRTYSLKEVELIKKIKELQGLGLSLKEIKTSLEQSDSRLEDSLLNALTRNRTQQNELKHQRDSIVQSLQSLKLNSSLERLSQEGIIMKFVKSFEEKHIIRGRMPYLEVLYETFVHLSGQHWKSLPLKEFHSADLVHMSEGITKKFTYDYSGDLKVLVSSEEQQFRNAFVFMLSPELLKVIAGTDVSVSELENEKELNLKITKWVNQAIQTFNHSWNATFTTIELENNGMLEHNDDLKKLYHDDEIFILSNMHTGNEEERFSVGLPYRFVSVVYNLLKR